MGKTPKHEEKPVSVESEVARFNRSLPIESAPTPPSSWYLRDDILDRESERVLLSNWQPVARRSQFVQEGDFVSGDFLGQPYLVTRGGDGQLRAFFNVCRHHAALIVEGQGCSQQLTCPYHGWTYDLEGNLRRAPRLGAVKEFHRQQYGLRPIALECWGPWVWLNFSSQPGSLQEPMRSLEKHLSPASLEKLSHVSTRSYEIACNWKVYVDNYLDGGYHVEVAHRGLAGQLDLDAYKTSVEAPWVLQTCGSAPRPTEESGDFAERVAGGAVYAWLYPNWMLNRYGPIMDTNWVIPLGPEKCMTVFEYFFEDPSDQDFIARSLEASHQVQLEDIAICESVQRGLRSRAYDEGRYAPSLEVGEYAFHHWLARDLMG